MWFKKMKHKKMQMFLVGLVLFATTALLTMCICFTMELESFAKRGITEKNCPDTYVFDIGSSGLLDNISDTEVKNEVEEVISITGRTISAPIIHEGNDISLYYDSLLNAEEYKKFGYISLEEKNAKLPRKGEIWVSKTVAGPNQINLGDYITLQFSKPVKLKVVGFYNCTSFPKSMPISPLIGNIEDINQLADSCEAALHAVILKNNSEHICEKLGDSDPNMKIAVSREDARQALTDVSSSLGGFGSAAGIIVFIVALVIIRFIIKSNLLKEYKAIGIYKSLGYTSGKIKGFYMKGYLMTGLVTIVLGSLSSLLLVYPLGKICTEYVQGFSISSTSFQICAIVSVTLFVLLYFNLVLSLKRVKKITPVEAIAVGFTSAEKKIKRSIIKSAKSSLAMAVNEMIKYKKTTIMLFMVLTVSMYLSMLFVMCYSSSQDMANKGNLWFAMPKKDVYISGNITEELKEYVKDSSLVKSIVCGECAYSPKTFEIDGKSSNELTNGKVVKEIARISFLVMDCLDTKITGVKVMDGYAPKRTGEIALCLGTSKMLGKKAGQYVQLKINDIKKEYFVSAVYNSMMNGGYGIMMQADDMAACDSNFKISRAYVCLNDKDDFKKFKKDVESHFQGVSVDDGWTAIENSVSSIEGMLTAVSMILVVVFIIFSMLNMFIVILMDNQNWRRRYGILKSVGFTTGYIIRQTLFKYSIISLVSLTVALLVHKAISAKFFGMMVMDAFMDNNLMLAALSVSFIALILVSAWLLSLSVKKISPVELMEE